MPRRMAGVRARFYPGGLKVKQWRPPWLPRFKRINHTALWGILDNQIDFPVGQVPRPEDALGSRHPSRGTRQASAPD